MTKYNNYIFEVYVLLFIYIAILCINYYENVSSEHMRKAKVHTCVRSTGNPLSEASIIGSNPWNIKIRH